MSNGILNVGGAGIACLLVGSLMLSGCEQGQRGGIDRSNELSQTGGDVERQGDTHPKQMPPRSAQAGAPEQQGPLASELSEHSTTHLLEGTVASVKSDRVELELEDGREVFVRTTARISVVRDGNRGSVRQLHEGEKVRASYTPVHGQANARQIEVLEPGR